MKTEKIDKGRKRLGTLAVLLLAFTMLPGIVSTVHAATCTSNADCISLGAVCSIPMSQATGTCASCATSAECVQKTFGKSTAWFSIAMAAVMIAILASGMLFSVGYAFGINQLKQIGRAELLQGFASLLLVVFLFGALDVEQNLIGSIEGSTGLISAGLATSAPDKFGITPDVYRQIIQQGGTITIDPFDVTYAFLKRMVDCIHDKYMTAMANTKWAEIIANMQLKLEIDTGPPPYGTNWALPTDLFKLIGGGGGIYAQVQRGELLADELTWTAVLIYAQLALLKFIETSMFTVFLPIGIILRAFPPTRGAGAVLAALAIGLYVIFPMTYLIFYIGTPNSLEGCNLQVTTAITSISANCPIYPSTMTETAGAAMAKTFEAQSNLMRVQTVSSQIRYLVWLYLLMAISITFIFVRSAAGILGADISEIGRSMFKMV